MKKLGSLILILLLTGFLTACSSSTDKVKIGVSGSDTTIWDFVAELAAEEDIEIEIVRFSDYVQPNLALAEGEVDLNAFQTISYFEEFIQEHDLDLVPIGTTVIAPMGLYSEKHDSVEDLPEGATIVLGSEVTNMGRALLLLQDAGLLTLEDDFDGNGALDKIVENPKKLNLELLASGQAPRVLPDVDAAIINNGIAVDAGLYPTEDSIFHEDETALRYLNIIAAKTEDKDNEVYKRIVELHQTDAVKELIIEDSNGNRIPTFIPLSELGY